MAENDMIESEDNELMETEDSEVSAVEEEILPPPMESTVITPKAGETIELEDAKYPVEFITSIRFAWLGNNYSFRRGEKAKVSKALKDILVVRNAVKAL